MGKKYSINSKGYIVAERDIYSLGGFIPKGSVGGKVASGKQLSQDGDCWLAGGDISGRPDVRIKDNAYVGTFPSGAGAVHTDGVTEFSGNTLIPGSIWVGSLAIETKNNVFIKDSFIGISMDVLCGPSTTTIAFPFEQGAFKAEAAKGTLFTSVSMRLDDTSACRSTTTLRPGRNTYLYIPTGYRARVFWAYYDNSNQLAYSGESTAVAAGLAKLNHLVYKLAMVSIVKNDGTAMTPANLLATGAKILGHISGSLLLDLRPESVSGEYVIVNSSLIATSGNFSLATTQQRFLAGGLYNTNMYTNTDRAEMKPYGTFRNVERLEYTKYLSDSHRTAATRDTYISAYDCPLLRVDYNTYDDSLTAKGNLTLRRCIVPEGRFAADPINGNTYEGIDFSYANEDLRVSLPGYAVFMSSHREGVYRVKAGVDITRGLVSYKGNLAGSARLTQAGLYLPLDGDIIEQGAYAAEANLGANYETTKVNSNAIVRTYKPVLTEGSVLPSMPTGFVLDAIIYLDEALIIRKVIANPGVVETTYKFAVMQFRRSDATALTASEFIALNRTLETADYTRVPEVTGSAYVGAGVIVRGDVKLIGDPYVNRLLDVNMWERGTTGDASGTWDDMTKGGPLPHRYRLVDVIPVEPGGSIECGGAFYIECNIFDINGRFLHRADWTKSYKIPENGAFLGLVLRWTSDRLIEDSDIPLANVKYLRAFKKRRYIVNELDRTSPKDILLGPDFFEQGNLAPTAGDYYEVAKRGDVSRLIFKRLLNAGRESTSTVSPAYAITKYAFDAITRFIAGGEDLENRALAGNLIRKEPESESAITPEEISFTRMVIEFTPTPRIIAPYGSTGITIQKTRVRLYDNAVLSLQLASGQDVVLKDNAVLGDVPGDCVCGNGHDDAITKNP